MKSSSLLFVVYAFIECIQAISGAYFCTQFFADVILKSPITLRVNDSAEAGLVLQRFTPPRGRSRRIVLESGNLDYLTFDAGTSALILSADVRNKMGKTIYVEGKCIDFIEPLAIPLDLPVRFEVEVVDQNDPPVFLNLPSVIEIEEATPIGSSIFTAAASDLFDVNPENRRHSFHLGVIDSEENDDRRDIFSINEHGQLELKKPLDYDFGARIYNITVTAVDEGTPPAMNQSILTVKVSDSDDLGPKHASPKYRASVIGEKPLASPEKGDCFATSPPIKAVDQDPVMKSPVQYRITKGPAHYHWDQYFEIQPESGMLCQLRPIPRTRQRGDFGIKGFRNFIFTVEAFQTNDPSKFDHATLHVSVEDQNIHTPVFQRNLWLTDIQEFPNITVGSKVIEVKATDADFGLNGIFEYELQGHADMFLIDRQSGLITVLKPRLLDREIQEQLEFQVIAKETSSVDRRVSTPSRVRVNLIDVNDNSPIFSRATYRYSIKDNHEVGAAVHKRGEGPRAEDEDTGRNGRVRYQISAITNTGGATSFADMQRFSVGEDSGNLKLSRSANDLRRRQVFPEYKITIIASDRAQPEDNQKFSLAVAYVKINESNDHPPAFPQSLYEAAVYEAAAVGTLVAKVQAEDSDGDEEIYVKYSIVSGDEGKSFQISNRGWITTAKVLDREVTSMHYITVQATDGKHSSNANISITVEDVNDNSPRFMVDSYDFHLNEAAAVGTPVGQVIAVDEDEGMNGRLRYSIPSGHGASLFSIDDAGHIHLAKRSPLLDSEQNEKLTLVVEAKDRGTPAKLAQASVNVILEDNNDNPPLFTQPVYLGSVWEDNLYQLPGQVVEMSKDINATDLDKARSNREIKFSFKKGEGTDIFAIEPSTAMVYVKSSGMLDCEIKGQYVLKVVATDQGGKGLSSEAQLIIKVKDKNDNAPEFDERYQFHLRGNVQVGTRVGKVRARDRDMDPSNNNVIYILKRGGYGKFTVDYETGDVMLSDELSREPLMAEYRVEVQALDSGRPRMMNSTTISITVPHNTAPEIIGPEEFYVAENQKPGAFVGEISARDKDGNDIVYSITESVPLSIHPSTGVISTSAVLDREAMDRIVFTVVIKDNGQPSKIASGKVTVYLLDADDNPPVLSQALYEGVVLEDNAQPLPEQVVQMMSNISATDADADGLNQQIRYSLAGKQGPLFTIDSVTGVISVSPLGTGNIDREHTTSYKLKVFASDVARSSLFTEADVIIRVIDRNDISPRFSKNQYSFHIYNKVQTGDIVGRVKAVDLDATSPNNEVMYFIESDSYGKFKINLGTGEISVLEGFFYKPRRNSYVMKVMAIDKGSPSLRAEALVVIKVEKNKYNDFKPEFKGSTIFYIQEEVRIGHRVGKVSVLDGDFGPDEQVNLKIDQSEHTVPFTINKSGIIRTASRLDRDSGRKWYAFKVIASDNGSPPQITSTYVAVILDDINDIPPKFSRSEYHHMVASQFPSGTEVATPFAYDDIDTTPTTYQYSLLGGRPGYFEIDRKTGVVTSTAMLSSLQSETMEFTIHALDLYNRELQASAPLTITIVGPSKEPCCCKPPCGKNSTSAVPP